MECARENIEIFNLKVLYSYSIPLYIWIILGSVTVPFLVMYCIIGFLWCSSLYSQNARHRSKKPKV